MLLRPLRSTEFPVPRALLYKKRASRHGDSPRKATRFAAPRPAAGGNLPVMPKDSAVRAGPRRPVIPGRATARARNHWHRFSGCFGFRIAATRRPE